MLIDMAQGGSVWADYRDGRFQFWFTLPTAVWRARRRFGGGLLQSTSAKESAL